MPNCQIGFSTLAKPHFSLFIFSVKVVWSPVTGILVLNILVPWTEIFSGITVPQDPFFQ